MMLCDAQNKHIKQNISKAYIFEDVQVFRKEQNQFKFIEFIIGTILIYLEINLSKYTMLFQEQNSQSNKTEQNLLCSQPPKQSNLPMKHKSNFVEEMRKRINSYHLEKIKLAQLKKEEQQWYKKQVQAKNALIEIEDFSISDAQPKSNQYTRNFKTQEISGWNHETLKIKNKNRVSIPQNQKHQQQIYFEKEQAINESIQFISAKMMENKQKSEQNLIQADLNSIDLSDKKNVNMIIYLKSLLYHLQSPTSKKDHRSHRGRIQSENKNIKSKTQQTVAKIGKSKISLHRIQGYEVENKEKQTKNLQAIYNIRGDIRASESGNSNHQNRALTFRKNEKKEKQVIKFKAIDAISKQKQSENRPITIQGQNTCRDYKKIKRNFHSQNQFDIAQEKDILQQLIRGTSNKKDSIINNYYSQKNQMNQKFTLKNLLC